MLSSDIPIDFEEWLMAKNKIVQIRLKRGKKEELEKRSEECKTMKIANTAVGTYGDNFSLLTSIPVIGMFFVPVSMAFNVVKGALDITQTAMDCDDVPFEEIKLMLEEKFHEVNRKLDEQTALLKRVHNLVGRNFEAIERSRLEMKEGFQNILETIHNNDLSKIVFNINNFVTYFDNERASMRGDSKERYIAKLQDPDSILVYLKSMRTSSEDSLDYALFELMEEDKMYVIPKSIDDENAFKALNALFYGTQSYVSIMFFLVEQYSYLAEYHYREGNYEEFNKNFNNVEVTFEEFKSSLIGKDQGVRGNVIDNVIERLNRVKNKNFIRYPKTKFHYDIVNQTNTLKQLKSQIKYMILPLIKSTPENTITISISSSKISTPVGGWVKGVTFQYALQYELNGKFSKLSKWTNKNTIHETANPKLTIPVDPNNNNRLIFRRFNNHKPQLVGVLRAYQHTFKDINRDLYNAAMDVNKNLGYKDFMKLLQSNEINMNAKFDLGWTVLHAAAYIGNFEIVKHVLLNDDTFDINEADTEGFTPLHIACKHSREDVVEFLVEHGADVTAKTKTGLMSALHTSAEYGFANVVKNLLKSTAISVNQVAYFGYTSLHAAVVGGIQVVRPLLEHPDIDVNAKSENGLTPLHLAVIKNNLTITKALIGGEADINSEDIDNMTPLHYASINGTKQMIQYLLSQNGNGNAVTLENNFTPLYVSIFFKNRDVALTLLEYTTINHHLPAIKNVTPFHLAVATGQIDIVKKLLSKGIDLEEKTEEGYTALHLASFRDETKLSSLLISKGADLDSRTSNNYTPLHFATRHGNINTLLYLLNMGADISAKTSDGSTALHIATEFKLLDAVRALLSKGANAKEYDDNGYLPIHKPILDNEIDIVKAVIEHDHNLLDEKTNEYKSITESIRRKLLIDIYNYLKDSNYPNKTHDAMYQYMEENNKFRITLFFIKDEDPKESLKVSLQMYKGLMEKCINGMDPETSEIDDTLIFDSPVLKMCYYRLPKKLRPLIIPNVRSTASFRRGINFEQSTSEVCSGNQDTGCASIPSKLAENRNYFKRATINSIDNLDIIPSLLLLDVLIRKITKKKYNINEGNSVLKLEPMYEDFAKNFTMLLEYFGNVPEKEKVYLNEIHMYLQNVAMTGAENQVKSICSYWKALSDFKPEEIKKLVQTYVSTKPVINPPTDGFYKELPQILATTCRNEGKW